jgi:alanine dehydrogenase
MLHLTLPQIRHLVGPAEAYQAMLSAFSALARGEVHQPPPIGLELDDRQGEVHLKGAYVAGQPHFAFKVATGFYRNPERGLPTGSGVVLVFDAWTGQPVALLQDDGYLTELRTAGAGALAADLIARHEADTVGLVGAGTQARFQLEALARVRTIRRVMVWSRTREHAEAFVRVMADRVGTVYRVVDTPDEAVTDADIALTLTPSRRPLVSADALHPGLHLTSVGSDGPGKGELDPWVLRRADRIFVDDLEQSATRGELQHALRAGILTREEITGTLAEVAAVLKPGRTTDEEVTLCDLTGVGAQDAAIASLTVERALAAGVGARLGPGE